MKIERAAIEKAIRSFVSFRACSFKTPCYMECETCEFDVSDDELDEACNVAIQTLKLYLDGIDAVKKLDETYSEVREAWDI